MIHGRLLRVKFHQGLGTREDELMGGMVVGTDNMIRHGIKVAHLRLRVSGVMFHRLGSRSDEIKYGGLFGSGAQAASTGLTSLSTRGRLTRQVITGGS